MAHAHRGGSQTYCYLEAKGFDSAGTKKTVNIPITPGGNYLLIEIKDINVSNGDCTIGLWTQANAGDYSLIDDVSFFKQP